MEVPPHVDTETEKSWHWESNGYIERYEITVKIEPLKVDELPDITLPIPITIMVALLIKHLLNPSFPYYR